MAHFSISRLGVRKPHRAGSFRRTRGSRRPRQRDRPPRAVDSHRRGPYNVAVREKINQLLASPGGQEALRLAAWVVGLSVGGVLLLWTLSSRGRWTVPIPTAAQAPRLFPSSAPERVTEGRFTHGTMLYTVLSAASLPPQKAQSVAAALTGVLDPRTLNEADRYELIHSTAGDFGRLSIVRKLERFVVESAPTGLVARKEPLPLATREKSVAGTLNDSLWASMTAGGLEPPVILAFSDIFAWSIDFLTEPRQGDRYALSWKEERTPDGHLTNVTITAAIYEGEETGRHTATFFAGDYYEEDGASLRKAFLHAPLNFRRISSGFTNRRFHPILRKWRAHHGTDYAAAIGTPVVSVGDGVVISRGWNTALGNLIKIRHNGMYTTYYGHLSRYAPGLAVGQHVKQGQFIGRVGSTGYSTGPHLHFQIMKNGSLVNFLTLKMPSVGRLPPGRMKAFLERRNNVLPPLEDLRPAPAA